MKPASLTITLNTRWRGKQTPIEVTITRVTLRTVSYIGVHMAISGALPHWQFLEDSSQCPQEETAFESLTTLPRSLGNAITQRSSRLTPA